MTVTMEEIKEVLKYFNVQPSKPCKPFVLIDCFRHRIDPENCDPKGCLKCNHFKELEAKYNGRFE